MPPVSTQFSRDLRKETGIGSKRGGQAEHRCSCTAVEESIHSFNMTWRGKGKKNSCQESFLSFYLSRTEMRCYNSPTAGHPKITTGNVRLQSVRWGQERWAAHFVVPPNLPSTNSPKPPPPPPPAHPPNSTQVKQDEDKRPTKTVTLTRQKGHTAMHTCFCCTSSRSIVCHAWWQTSLLKQTSLILIWHSPPQSQNTETYLVIFWHLFYQIQNLYAIEMYNLCENSRSELKTKTKCNNCTLWL